jgi:hypothetical protein
MKPDARLVNTSRGPIIDEHALIACLSKRRIAAAALDVFDVEPLPECHPFRTKDNVLATPHVGYVPHILRRHGREYCEMARQPKMMPALRSGAVAATDCGAGINPAVARPKHRPAELTMTPDDIEPVGSLRHPPRGRSIDPGN